MRVALDAMGGDLAPREAIAGALRAIETDADIQVILVGREDEIRRHLPDPANLPDRLTIVHAAEVIGCHEAPADGLRKKRDNSISKMCALVAGGQADACLSAGNTGAVVGAATLTFRLIPGVLKAGIAVALGTKDHLTVLIDVGANVYCKPVHLLHYGMMAAVYAEKVLRRPKSRVALLSIGAEDSKGNDLVKETRDLFGQAPFLFIGYVEGNDIFAEKADVVVCEGFVGNVMLKLAEGLSEKFHARFEDIFGVLGDVSKTPELMAKINSFRKATDYAEIGGAPLLGVNGTCLIAHGRSDGRALANALILAARTARAGVIANITEGLKAHQAT